MFYSHEILTSRKYGIATVWLVATLGAKSHSKKINRKAIQDVDLPKACKTIIEPAAPMALRLQSNLLYGVMRVYLQQCRYVLSDAEAIYHAMHIMLRSVQDAALDPDAGKARPEQLILQDDPSFLPEFAVPPTELLAQLDIGPPLDPALHVGDSQSLTPFGSQQHPSTPGPPIGGLVLPVSSSARSGGFGGLGDVGFSSVGGASGGLPDIGGFDDAISDPGFTFDDDGNLVDLTDANEPAQPGTPSHVRGAAMQSDDQASARVRQEHEEGLQAGAEQFDDQMDLDLPILGDDLPDAEAFSPTAQKQPSHSSDTMDSSPAAAAPIRRKQRAARIIPADTTNELRSRDLADWNDNYLANMEAASQAKNQKLLARQAKQNADYWVWGAGIGGIGARIQGTSGANPFQMFMGDNLFEHFTGLSRKVSAGTKRDRDSGIDDVTQEESRRVRRKTDEPVDDLARGLEDEAMFIPGGDEVELPRDAPAPLDDDQLLSAMPWNISASIRGSSAVPRSGRGHLTGSVGFPSSLTATRRGVRLVSASPLHGRGRNSELQGLMPDLEEGDSSFDDYAGFAGPGFSSDMPAAATAGAEENEADSRANEALGLEGENFLAFIADAIDKKGGGRDQDADGDIGAGIAEVEGEKEVLFDELISPTQNNKMVASHALMMALTLGTKGLLNVRQDNEYEEIGLSLTEKAKTAQLTLPVVAEDDGDGSGAGENQNRDDENGDDANQEAEEDFDLEEEVGGQFEEQFEAGLVDDEEEENEGEDGSIYGE
ncbi:hypothetical protein DM02DRAFT_576286 [Periconia macrospinosa]|uniref:Rad21/Rec8-like protein N-terminal domain-containing protein n=1 Tax=Periconia macrospinosa TaxID=97972 RepID=A0A2V1D215_9PLEO|nr:hypothetical protein DM02DRAFT_576286 [Periconia macrospinosa]